MLRWATDEVWLARGRKTVPFTPSVQPVAALFLEQVDSGRYSECHACGPSQSGKTTACWEIPTAYASCELCENVVAGIPLDEMVHDKFGSLFGMMRRSPRLRGLLPATHRQGPGGRIKEKQTLSNGAEINPMTVNGSDAAAAGYTARWVNITEAKEFGRTSATSVEADRIRQLAARQRSFPAEERRLIAEGTVGTAEQLPWRMRGADDGPVLSTASRILSPCPHCPAWIAPERDRLVGWQNAESVLEASEKAVWLCPACDGAITDDQRRASVRAAIVVHRGQSVDSRGDVVGEHPPTRTLFFRYTGWHNLLVPQGDLAADEWRAAQLDEGTFDRENAERELCQFVHATPFRSTLVENEPLTAPAILKRRHAWPRNICPPDTQKLAIGVDLGDWTGWWGAVAGRSGGQMAVVAYGKFGVKLQKSDDRDERIRQALRQFLDEVVGAGLVEEGAASRRLVDRTWVDGNYASDPIADVVREQGGVRQRALAFCRGAGASTRRAFGRGGSAFKLPRRRSRTTRRIGRQWYEELNHDRRIHEITFNADYWKLQVDEALRSGNTAGAPGTLTLPEPTAGPNEHSQLAHHLANEQLTREWKPGVGVQEKWVRTGEQHLKDALAMALAALDECGWRPDPDAVEAAQAELEPAVDDADGGAPSIDWGVIR